MHEKRAHWRLRSCVPFHLRCTASLLQMNIQLLYEAALCCWELSFYRPAADVLCGSTNVVGALVDVVRLAQVRTRLLAVCRRGSVRHVTGAGAAVCAGGVMNVL